MEDCKKIWDYTVMVCKVVVPIGTCLIALDSLRKKS